MLTEAGATLFSRGRNIEAALGLRSVYLKFEGSNPTGTQKDRIARHCYEDAHAKGFDTITVATCGNFGASMAWACSHNGIRPAVFVPSDYSTPRLVEMERLGARIFRVPGDYEDAVQASRDAARAHGVLVVAGHAEDAGAQALHLHEARRAVVLSLIHI